MPELLPLTSNDHKNLMTFFNKDTITDQNNGLLLNQLELIKQKLKSSMELQPNGTSNALDSAKIELDESSKKLVNSLKEISKKPQVRELLDFINSNVQLSKGETFFDYFSKNEPKGDLKEAFYELRDIQFKGALKDDFENLRNNYNDYKTDLMLYNIMYSDLIINSDFDLNKKTEFNNQRENIIKNSIDEVLPKIDHLVLMDSPDQKNSFAVDLNKIVDQKFELNSNTANSDRAPSKTVSSTYSP